MKKGRKGRRAGGEPSCILLSSTRPDPAPLPGPGRGPHSHQLGVCCTFLTQTVAGVPFLTLPAKPEIPLMKAQFSHHPGRQLILWA